MLQVFSQIGGIAVMITIGYIYMKNYNITDFIKTKAWQSINFKQA
jgi:hypothetical protein